MLQQKTDKAFQEEEGEAPRYLSWIRDLRGEKDFSQAEANRHRGLLKIYKSCTNEEQNGMPGSRITLSTRASGEGRNVSETGKDMPEQLNGSSAGKRNASHLQSNNGQDRSRDW